jgi:hypothetical protein
MSSRSAVRSELRLCSDFVEELVARGRAERMTEAEIMGSTRSRPANTTHHRHAPRRSGEWINVGQRTAIRPESPQHVEGTCCRAELPHKDANAPADTFV